MSEEYRLRGIGMNPFMSMSKEMIPRLSSGSNLLGYRRAEGSVVQN